MNRLGLTPKDNELRMQVGFRLSHDVEYRLYVADKDGNWECPMEALQELLALVRTDEREAQSNMTMQAIGVARYNGEVVWADSENPPVGTIIYTLKSVEAK